MFGLRVYRHRAFECSIPITQPEHPAHKARCARNGYLPEAGAFMTITGGKHSRAWRRCAADTMGVPWMQTVREVCESIPPAYTEYIGGFLMEHLKRVVA
jgi:DNA (cytosine-5)-methyltransferase 1